MKNPKPIPAVDTATNLKRKKTCKGGQPHDWVAVLPSNYEAVEGVYQGSVEPLYDSFKELSDLRVLLTAKLASQGIIEKRGYSLGWRNDSYREYICATCGKKDHRIRD